MAAVPAPLSFQDIYAYAHIFDVGDFQRFLMLIKCMDATYLEETMKKSGSDKKKVVDAK